MKTITVQEFRDFFPQRPAMEQGNDFFIMDLEYHPHESVTPVSPCSFEGVVVLYCIEGNFSLTIGLNNYALAKDNFAIALPGDIVSLTKEPSAEEGIVRIMAVSDRLLKEMEFDLSRANIIFRHRVIKANKQYKLMIHHFRNLFRSIILAEHNESTKSLGYLLRAMNIEIAHIWEHLVEAPERAAGRNGSLADTFVTLVARHHMEHRDIDFYALQMHLTPKYLSSLIRSVTGRTATDWIASYIILEAKYSLKHTNMQVKEIAFSLHFNNQMDFYRYFRRHAGLSPKEYRQQELEPAASPTS